MALYYKIVEPKSPLKGIQVFETNNKDSQNNGCKQFDFSKHVLIELLDDVTPEAKLWEKLGLSSDKSILHKRMMVDSHRVHCRRAIVVCADSLGAKQLVERVSQTKIMKRCVCASIVEDLLFDFKLFEKQILQLGDKRSQHQLLYVTDLNRCREVPVLAQYLRDIFSPFGTVLSVFVSEDKDGIAHPEGVIKFAHLSEAFAAELALDQFVIGMERLSATTHHNILLSQCDLRVRLKEAQKYHNETLNNHLFTTSLGNSSEYPLRNGSLSARCSKQISPTKSPSSLSNIKSPSAFSDSNLSHSTELDDVLKNPCKSNLIECLQSMALCSDSSATDALSQSNLTELDQMSSSHSCSTINNIDSCSSVTLPLKEQDWSSRINSWITTVSNDKRHQLNFTNGSTNKLHLSSMNKVNSNDIGSVSSVCSFITCDNSLPNHSVVNTLSPTLLSDSDGDDTVMEASSSESFHTTIANSKSPHDMSLTCFQSDCSASYSISQRSNKSSQKLSLKSQRLGSSLVNNSDTTLLLPQNSKSCDAITKVKYPVIRLKRLSPEEIHNLCKHKDVLRPLKHPKVSYGSSVASEMSDNKENNPNETQPSRRVFSRRLSSRSNSSVQSESQLKLASNLSCITETDSPLRLWLKNDLKLSSNVNVFGSSEHSKKLVCATASKNVLAHVGCSHMTCDACYPGSTNLLLGCY